MPICLDVKAIPQTITLPDPEVRCLYGLVRPVVERGDGLYYLELRNPVMETYVKGKMGARADGLRPLAPAPFLTRHERIDTRPDIFWPSLAEPFSQLPTELLERASAIRTTLLGATEFAEQLIGLTVLYRRDATAPVE